MNSIFLVIGFFLSNLNTKLEINQNETQQVDKKKKSTFGDMENQVEFLKIEENINFKNFMKPFVKGCVLRQIGRDYIGYSTKDFICIFNVISNQITSLSLSKMNRIDKIQCFSFDSEHIYVKFRKYIRIFDVNGIEVATYNFTTKEVNAADLFVDKNYFYLVTHNKDIFGFRFDSKMKDIKLIFYNNDFYSTRLGKFNFVIGDDIYILNNKRFSVIHKQSGKVLKNIILDIFFDNLLLLKNNVFLYSKDRFAMINLSNFIITYNNQINLFEEKFIVNGSQIRFGSKIYRGDYIYTYFFDNVFFRYAQNTYDSRCFLIKNNVVFEFILEDFVICNVMKCSKGLLLIDTKNKKIKLI